MDYTYMYILVCAFSIAESKNIILFLTDDLDLVLDGMTPLKNTVNLIGGAGKTFKNAFVASPVCCPNRATILTGKYMHNHSVRNNSVEGNCNGFKWQQDSEKQTFANILKSQSNYTTFYAGKYLNQYGTAKTGGVSHVPPGWDFWYGLVGNSKYYDYSLSVNGKEKRYGSRYREYLTDVISNLAKDFILKQTKDRPFMMVLAPPAPHSPFVPANRHVGKFDNVTAKRTPNFNKLVDKEKRHWLLRMEPTTLPNEVVNLLDAVYRKRWETLLAVDEMVLQVHEILKKKQLLEDTYLMFTSDNGYHIGQFGLAIDKRQPYETDIRVPFLISGPGIKPSEEASPIGSIDIFATILDIAGLKHPSDGISILNKLFDDRSFLIEYTGEKSHGELVEGCPEDDDSNLSFCSSAFACKCEDSGNNTYICVRRMSSNENTIFCQFQDEEKFLEMYNLNADPFQLNNIAWSIKSYKRRRFRNRLRKFVVCHTESCFQFEKKLPKQQTN